MKHNTINKLLLALPGLILSTSILSAFSLLAFCMRSIPMAFLLVGISAFGWSGILAAITKFYDKLMNIWQTRSYPLFIGSWMLLSFLVSMSFGFEKSNTWNISVFTLSILASISIPCLIFKKIIEIRLENRVSQAKNSDYVVLHKTYEQENA